MTKYTFRLDDHQFREGEKVVVIEADGIPCGTVVAVDNGVNVLSAHIVRVTHEAHPIIDGYRFAIAMDPRRYRIENGRKVFQDPH